MIDVDPGGHRVVIRERKFILLMRHRETFDQPHLIIHARKTAAAIINSASDYFEGKAGSHSEIQAKQSGIEVRAESIDIVEEKIFELWIFSEQFHQDTVAEHVRNFEPVPDWMHALQR